LPSTTPRALAACNASWYAVRSSRVHRARASGAISNGVISREATSVLAIVKAVQQRPADLSGFGGVYRSCTWPYDCIRVSVHSVNFETKVASLAHNGDRSGAPNIVLPSYFLYVAHSSPQHGLTNQHSGRFAQPNPAMLGEVGLEGQMTELSLVERALFSLCVCP
jgi:hypothetical protein